MTIKERAKQYSTNVVYRKCFIDGATLIFVPNEDIV